MILHPLHIGIVEAVGPNFLKINLVTHHADISTSHGGGVASFFSHRHERDGLFVERQGVGHGLKPGTRVILKPHSSSEWRVFTLGVLLPIMIFLGCITGGLLMELGIRLTGIVAIIAVAVYYFMLRVFKGQLHELITWQIERADL